MKEIAILAAAIVMIIGNLAIILIKPYIPDYVGLLIVSILWGLLPVYFYMRKKDVN